MKIIILVQGCEDYPYKAIQDAQMNTWDNVQVDNVDTYFYMGNDKHEDETELIVQTIVSPFKEKSVSKHKKIFVPCSESYNMMHWRYKLALDYIWNEDWDFIFRTNTSSYVDKQKLFDFANTMMTEKCYCGIDGGGFASGCGVLISRDVAKIFKEQFDSHPTDSEDCLMGTYATRNGIELPKEQSGLIIILLTIQTDCQTFIITDVRATQQTEQKIFKHFIIYIKQNDRNFNYFN